MKRIGRISVVAAGAAAAFFAVAPAANAGFTSDWSLAKTHPAGTYNVGQNVTFTLTVHAVSMPQGNGTQVTVTDTLPNGLTYVSFTAGSDGWSCTPSGQTVTCTGAPDISTGQDSTFTITTSIGAAAAPKATNSAVLSASNDQDSSNNTATDTVNVQAASPSRTPSPSPKPKPSPTVTHHPSPAPTPAVLPTSGARLPFTGPGHQPVPFILAAGALFVVGAGLVGFARRRRTS
jgi:fimbrial isopeptide formation D2 family protein